MKITIPAKTFLLGEYVAIAEGPAIIITTNPCFELQVTNQEELTGIHQDSPAGLWWQKTPHPHQGLSWTDPYNGRGGLGASSAQFLASYLADCALQHITPNLISMLTAYYEVAWNGVGLKPSGYDVIAQSQQACVYINKQNKIVTAYDWPFADLSFIIVHTGKKLATHHHLQNTALPKEIKDLSLIADKANDAFAQIASEQLINCINDYHQQLAALGLIADHTQVAIADLCKNPEILAIKGCGALGADTILLLTKQEHAASLESKVVAQGWLIVATTKDLTRRTTPSLLESRL